MTKRNSVLIAGGWTAAALVGGLGAAGLGGCVADYRGPERVGECPVHHVEMVARTVPIRYGEIEHPEGYLEARRKSFPYGEAWVAGGSAAPARSPKRARVWMCPECEMAWREWEAAHAGAGR